MYNKWDHKHYTKEPMVTHYIRSLFSVLKILLSFSVLSVVCGLCVKKEGKHSNTHIYTMTKIGIEYNMFHCIVCWIVDWSRQIHMIFLGAQYVCTWCVLRVCVCVWVASSRTNKQSRYARTIQTYNIYAYIDDMINKKTDRPLCRLYGPRINSGFSIHTCCTWTDLNVREACMCIKWKWKRFTKYHQNHRTLLFR